MTVTRLLIAASLATPLVGCIEGESEAVAEFRESWDAVPGEDKAWLCEQMIMNGRTRYWYEEMNVELTFGVGFADFRAVIEEEC